MRDRYDEHVPPRSIIYGSVSIGETMETKKPSEALIDAIRAGDMERANTLIRIGAVVDGDLNLAHQTGTLPDNLMIGGSLVLRYSDVGALPHDLTVNGNLDLFYASELTSLPADLTVKGDLILSYTAIRALPYGLFEGGLDLTGSNISTLPRNLWVGGALRLSDTKITELPENLRVGADLYLDGTAVVEVPESAEIGGRVVGLKGR